MKSIRAFVGHSFNSKDESIVGKFLEQLDTAREVIPGFSWERAKRPEPKVVTEKVLALFAEKNVFIGICTRKELVVHESAIHSSWWGSRRVDVAKLQWKASDWVLQEIGLAVGLGLRIIVLLENGVRVPGELQGNLEYIPFDRDNPQLAFGPLLLMLKALDPLPRSVASVLEEQTVSPAESDSQAESEDPAPLAPQANWRVDEFEFAYLRAVALGLSENAAEIDRAFTQGALCEIGDNSAAWRASKEWAAVQFDKQSSILSLKVLRAENPASARVARSLAKGLDVFGEHAEAAKQFEAAAELSLEPKDKLATLARAITSHQSNGDDSSAQRCADLMREIVNATGVGEETVLRAERALAEKYDQAELYVATLERLLEIDPSNHDERFALGYKYSQLDLDELAVLHYSRIPSGLRSSAVWNNLGVSFDAMKLPARAVDSYRAAELQGETLAMSNLAGKQLSEGFVREATDYCVKAAAINNHHKNVDSTLARIKSIEEEEDQEEAELTEKVRPLADFYRRMGLASTRTPRDFSGRWRGPKCELTVSMSGREIRIVGEYKEEVNSGLRRLAIGPVQPTMFRQMKVEYVGKLCGRTIVGSVSRGRVGEGDLATVLGSFGSAVSFAMWVSDSGEQLNVCEQPKSSKFVIYEISR